MNLEHFSLQNKIALITGGGSGLGFGIASSFINAGAKVIISGRRENILIQSVEILGKNASYIVNDITDVDKLPYFVNYIEETHGPIDILVNNAGINLKKNAQETTDEEFFNVINVNLLSVFSLTRVCAERMLRRKKGCILMISSMAAFFGIEKIVAYSASKSALTGLINSLVSEFSEFNVRVNGIAPGWIETDMFIKAIDNDPDRENNFRSRIAMGHFGKPSDIGNAAIFLCSDAAQYVTGVILKVDGGASVYF